MQELCKQVDDYIATYDPGDELEWSLVLAEIRAFIEVSGRCWSRVLSVCVECAIFCSYKRFM